jgi:pyruvate formate lyase activating enzyme
MEPKEVYRRARKKKCITITYTYTEPAVYYEYLMEVASYTRSRGMKNHIATALYISKQPLQKLLTKIDAVTAALKGFSEKFYQKMCGCSLKPVLDALIEVKAARKVWLEIVTLIVPTYNDDLKQIKEMCNWIVKNLGPDVPVHFARFVPAFRLKQLPQTPIKVLEAAREEARMAGIHYPYLANLAGHRWADTYCHRCGALLIRRLGVMMAENRLKARKYCPRCGIRIPGVFR